MFVIKHSVQIDAPLERVFLLSTSLELVERVLGMQAVMKGDATRTTGLVEGGDRIRWEGWQMGMPVYHVSLISAYEPNRFFQDTMVAGRFRTFSHDHAFSEAGGQVLLEDTVRFSLPLGVAGRLVGKYGMVPHIRGLLARRFALLKRIAESDQWRQYLVRFRGSKTPPPVRLEEGRQAGT